MATHPKHADCENCEAPCCRRQVMTLDDRPAMIKDMRPIYLEAGTNITVVGYQVNEDGTRQPTITCNAFNLTTMGCGIYHTRPAHCRDYDCRDDDPDNWESRAHCDISRHKKLEAARARKAARA